MNELNFSEMNLLRAELITITARNLRLAGKSHIGKDIETFLLKDCGKLQAICDKLGISVELKEEAEKFNNRKFPQ